MPDTPSRAIERTGVQRRPPRQSTVEARWGVLFISPWILGFLVFVLGPMIASLVLSLTDYEVTGSVSFVGLANYTKALTNDRLFWKALRNTLFYVELAVPLGLALSLMCALLLNRKIHGLAVYRLLFYMPSVVPVVASTMLFIFLLQPDFGLVNAALWQMGVRNAPRWFSSIKWAKPALVVLALWAGAGGSRMIIFLAGLQGIPTSLYEAAEIDGAGALRRFFSVTLPLLSPTIFYNLVISVIAALKVFAASFVATGGGPGDATRFYVLYLFERAFRHWYMGYASALAWILFLIIIALTLLQFRLAKSWVFYMGEGR